MSIRYRIGPGRYRWGNRLFAESYIWRYSVGRKFFVRVKQSVSEFSISESFSSTLSYMRKTFLTVIVNGVASVGNGAIGGWTTFLWGGHPW